MVVDPNLYIYSLTLFWTYCVLTKPIQTSRQYVKSSLMGRSTRTSNPLLSNISLHILHTTPYTFSYGSDKENLFNNQELL